MGTHCRLVLRSLVAVQIVTPPSATTLAVGLRDDHAAAVSCSAGGTPAIRCPSMAWQAARNLSVSLCMCAGKVFSA